MKGKKWSFLTGFGKAVLKHSSELDVKCIHIYPQMHPLKLQQPDGWVCPTSTFKETPFF